jgi:hypothetical protein
VTRRRTRELDRLAAYGFPPGTPTGSGHVRFRHPAGGVVHTSSTPSDRRAWRNLRAQLRRVARTAGAG